MRLLLAFKIFFAVLFQADLARQVERLLRGEPLAEPPAPAQPKPAAPPPPQLPARSEALTLLAALQREARFIDFIMEPLDDYSDDQVGAAARDVHRDCRQVLERAFHIEPLEAQPEGAALQLAPGFDAGRYRLTGNVSGEPPFNGRMVHHGWLATRCELPTWNGSDDAARVVAPAEVEL